MTARRGNNEMNHGLRTPNEGINQRNLKIGADVADKICFGRTKNLGAGVNFILQYAFAIFTFSHVRIFLGREKT